MEGVASDSDVAAGEAASTPRSQSPSGGLEGVASAPADVGSSHDDVRATDARRGRWWRRGERAWSDRALSDEDLRQALLAVGVAPVDLQEQSDTVKRQARAVVRRHDRMWFVHSFVFMAALTGAVLWMPPKAPAVPELVHTLVVVFLLLLVLVLVFAVGYFIIRAAHPLGRPVDFLVGALEQLAMSHKPGKAQANLYARAEAALASAPPSRFGTQAARQWQLNGRAQAAHIIGELERDLLLRRVTDGHRHAVAVQLVKLLLDRWPDDAPTATGSRLAAAGRAAPNLARLGAVLAAISAAIPVSQAIWLGLHWLLDQTAWTP